jgi:hypothetical protein
LLIEADLNQSDSLPFIAVVSSRRLRQSALRCFLQSAPSSAAQKSDQAPLKKRCLLCQRPFTTAHLGIAGEIMSSRSHRRPLSNGLMMSSI